MNKVILVGNVGESPIYRELGNDKYVAHFNLATDYRNKTEWHKVVCFGSQAEFVHKYCEKGKRLAVEGRLETRKWQDKDGVDRYTTEIIASEVTGL